MSDAPETDSNKVPAVVNFTIAPAPEPKAHLSNKIAVAKLVLEYAKALVWPLFVGVLLLVYQPPIEPLLESLTEKLKSASSVKIGSLSLEVQEKANDLGVPGLGLKIGQLSADSIEKLLQVRRDGSMILLSQNGGKRFGLPQKRELNALLDLEKKGLIGPYDSGGEPIADFVAHVKKVAKFIPKEAHDKTIYDNFEIDDPSGEFGKKLHDYGYSLTPAGQKAVEAITKAVASQLSKE